MSDSELIVANRGIWIPNAVWESKDLSIQEKALLAKIHGFKECFASNGYLADFLGLSVTRVKALIKSLDDKGYITRTEERQGQMTVKRTLHVVEAKYFGVIEHGPENGPTPAQKQAHPQPENGHHSNTVLEVQNNNTVSASSDDGGQCDLIPEDKETSKPEKPKKPRLNKPDNWKQFYAEYPANRRGGSDATPWEKAKKMRLTEDDFAAMLEDVKKRKLTDSWRNGFVPGITKYLTEETWKVPLTWPNPSYQTNQNQTKVDVDAAMAPRAVRRQESTPEQLKRNQEQAANLLNMFKGG